jgi:signal transduction histidine kinase
VPHPNDLRVRATPLDLNGCTYFAFAATDIGHEKRREALERVFFHDVMNTAGNILGATCLLQDEEMSINQKQLLDILRNSSEQLVEEVKFHRALLSAELGDLAVDAEPLEALKVLTTVGLRYSASELAIDRDIRLGTPAEAVSFVSDRVLLSRVLGNALKNGLEASSPGETVTLCCWEEQGAVVFSVHSPVAMSPSVQRQIFQRSFSTKGPGRGIGTYSAKLLAEKYLGGSVWFESSEATGTRFFLRIPLRTG